MSEKGEAKADCATGVSERGAKEWVCYICGGSEWLPMLDFHGRAKPGTGSACTFCRCFAPSTIAKEPMDETKDADVRSDGACTCREPGGMVCPVHECLCRECDVNGEVEVATWFDGAPGVDVAPCPRCGGTGQEPRLSQPDPIECRTCRRDSENATECDDCGPENSFSERSPMEPRR